MYNIIALLGLPGSGKGTQGSMLSKNKNIPHVSTGDIFRKMSSEDSKDGALLKSYMNKGKLIPSDLVNKLVIKFILDNYCNQEFILDGYPRTLDQAKYLESNLEVSLKVIFFDIEETKAIDRILSRIICSSCSRIFNDVSDKPLNNTCTSCGSKEFITRSDDEKEIVLSRMKEYKSETLPLVEFYKKKNVLFTVNAESLQDEIMHELSSIVK